MARRSDDLKLILFSVIFCPEMAVLLAIPLCCLVLNQFIEPFISKLSLASDRLKFLSFIAISFLVLILKDFKPVLQPEHPNKEVLLQWPDYWSLKVAYLGAVLYCAVFAVIGLSVWLISSNKLTVYMASALVFSILGSAVSYWTVLLAKAKVQEILAKSGAH